jgi:hypothetical protein
MADIFWTDSNQARERLTGTVVLYDGLPVFISNVEDGENFANDGVPRANITFCGDTEGNRQRKRLDSPKFNKFRSLPELGWLNTTKYGAILLSRKATRSRLHGLNSSNIRGQFFHNSGQYSLTPYERVWDDFYNSSSFVDLCKDVYPALGDVLLNVQEESALAFSRKFVVYRDTLGLRWLYRETERIGIFTNSNSLNLLEKFKFYREEIMNDRKFTLDNIQEY